MGLCLFVDLVVFVLFLLCFSVLNREKLVSVWNYILKLFSVSEVVRFYLDYIGFML